MIRHFIRCFFWVMIFVRVNSLAMSETYQYKVCFKSNCFDVELALTPKERSKGLMLRDKMPETKGMLFVFEEEGKHPFWMKNTFIPLDLIWISKDKEIVFISKDNRPCLMDSCPLIYPQREALYVLEVNAGIVDNTGIKAGDKIDFFVNP